MHELIYQASFLSSVFSLLPFARNNPTYCCGLFESDIFDVITSYWSSIFLLPTQKINLTCASRKDLKRNQLYESERSFNGQISSDVRNTVDHNEQREQSTRFLHSMMDSIRLFKNDLHHGANLMQKPLIHSH